MDQRILGSQKTDLHAKLVFPGKLVSYTNTVRRVIRNQLCTSSAHNVCSVSLACLSGLGVGGPVNEEAEGLRNVELVKSVSGKHYDLSRPSVRSYSVFKGLSKDAEDREKGKYTLIRDVEDQTGIYDKPLPCFGCGVGWFSFLLGFAFPLMWYYATLLYFGNYYRKDPRERAGLAASAIAAMGCTVVLLIVGLFFLF